MNSRPSDLSSTEEPNSAYARSLLGSSNCCCSHALPFLPNTYAAPLSRPAPFL
jgi:hypothetical protein